MLVTIFDETMAAHVRSEIRACHVTSLADIVAPSLAGPCLAEDLVAVDPGDDPPVGLREEGDRAVRTPIDIPSRHRVRALLHALLQPYDRSAGLLLFGALGIAGVLIVETIGGLVVLGQGPADALYGAGKTVATVDPNGDVDDGPTWFKSFITASMLVTLVFEASFTAGLVNRLIDRRLTGIVGRRAVPRRDHVVVIGLGQVGLRLCTLLRRCGIGVVAVDDREEGENVGMARELGLPVVIGRGADVSLLRRLSLGRAVALARSPTTTSRTSRSRWPRGRSRRSCGWSSGPATAGWRTRRGRCSASGSCATCTASPRSCSPRRRPAHRRAASSARATTRTSCTTTAGWSRQRCGLRRRALASTTEERR